MIGDGYHGAHGDDDTPPPPALSLVERRFPNPADRLSAWATDGLCVDHPLQALNAWFDLPTVPHVAREQLPGANGEEAIAVCMACPVRRKCRDWALGMYESGIWGGTTDLDRQQMRKARGLPTVDTEPVDLISLLTPPSTPPQENTTDDLYADSA